MQEIITISLLNLAVFVLLSEGYVLHPLAVIIQNATDKVFGMKWADKLRAPLFECYVCMSSVWTLIWGFEFSFYLPVKMLLVCSVSYLIEKVITEREPTAK